MILQDHPGEPSLTRVEYIWQPCMLSLGVRSMAATHGPRGVILEGLSVK